MIRLKLGLSEIESPKILVVDGGEGEDQVKGERLQGLGRMNHELLKLVEMNTNDETGLELDGTVVVRLDDQDESAGEDVSGGRDVLAKEIL